MFWGSGKKNIRISLMKTIIRSLNFSRTKPCYIKNTLGHQRKIKSTYSGEARYSKQKTSGGQAFHREWRKSTIGKILKNYTIWSDKSSVLNPHLWYHWSQRMNPFSLRIIIVSWNTETLHGYLSQSIIQFKRYYWWNNGLPHCCWGWKTIKEINIGKALSLDGIPTEILLHVCKKLTYRDPSSDIRCLVGCSCLSGLSWCYFNLIVKREETQIYV